MLCENPPRDSIGPDCYNFEFAAPRSLRSSVDDYAEYLLDGQADDLLRDWRFDAQKPTVFYFHGYTEHADKESVRTVMSGKQP